MPFRWDLEDDERVVDRKVKCTNPQDIGKISADSMTCHFLLQMPDDTQYTFTRKCNDRSLTKMNRYKDLQDDLGQYFPLNR